MRGVRRGSRAALFAEGEPVKALNPFRSVTTMTVWIAGVMLSVPLLYGATRLAEEVTRVLR